jgi:cupin fold WbuC family metalloprotein
LSDRVQLISPQLIEVMRNRAGDSARKRSNYNFHASADAPVHRFLNVLTRGSYVQPHRHVTPPKHESFIVLEGSLAVFLFDDDGHETQRYILSAEPGENRGIDLPAGVWHTVTALTDVAVCFEVKPGPWDPASDKDFAPWAPPESDGEAARAWLESILSV